MVEQSFRGSCACGAVVYRIEPPFLGFQNCYCSRCRKRTGTAHGSSLFVAADRLSWEQGEEHAQRWEMPSAKYYCTGFCDVCGSALPWKTRTGKAFVVPAGGLDDDPQEKPVMNIFHASRAPWLDAPHELPTHAEMPPRK